MLPIGTNRSISKCPGDDIPPEEGAPPVKSIRLDYSAGAGPADAPRTEVQMPPVVLEVNPRDDTLSSLCLRVLQIHDGSAFPQQENATVTTGKSTVYVQRMVCLAFHERVCLLQRSLDAADIRDDAREYLLSAIDTYFLDRKVSYKSAFKKFNDTVTDKLGLGKHELEQILSKAPALLINEVNEYYNSKELLADLMDRPSLFGKKTLGLDERITTLAPLNELLPSYPHVKVIDVPNRYVKRLPTNLHQIEKYYSFNSCLNNYPARFQAPNLISLTIFYSQDGAHLPDCSLPSLKILSLVNVGLSAFPRNFQAENLEELQLKQVPLTTPLAISLPSLKRLVIQSMPPLSWDSLQCHSLEELTLESTPIESLPKFDYSHLIFLEITNTKIKSLAAIQATNLEDLRIHNSPLEELPKGHFSKLEKLTLLRSWEGPLPDYFQIPSQVGFGYYSVIPPEMDFSHSFIPSGHFMNRRILNREQINEILSR